ncbi:unnamed protein product, partial [Gulo gulo]
GPQGASGPVSLASSVPASSSDGTPVCLCALPPAGSLPLLLQTLVGGGPDGTICETAESGRSPNPHTGQPSSLPCQALAQSPPKRKMLQLNEGST